MSARRRAAAFAAVGLLAAIVGSLAYAAGVPAGLELDSVDERFSVRGAELPSQRLVVVAIDDATFGDLGEQWPFRRSLHGKLIDRLREAGVRAIGYDVQFTEPTVATEDNALIEAVERAGNVVLATTEAAPDGRSNVFGGEAVLRRIGARAASALVAADADGVTRRFPAAIQGLDGFAVAVAQEAGGGVPGPDDFEPGGAWIDYAGPPGTVPTVSFSRVLSGDVDPRVLRGKIAVVGAVAPSLQDVHPTAIGGGLMPGVELQANAIATVLDGLPLRSAPGAVAVALIALLAALAALAGWRLPPLAAIGVAMAVAALYLLLAQLAFDGGLVLPVVYPLLALAIAAIGTLLLHYLLAAFERQRVRLTFSRFVPEDVVEEVLAHGEGQLLLGGARRECTVLFADLRGFTAYSESRDPGQVVAVLNRYLGAMTEAIMVHGGTLVSYMGDGIFAVFGAPIAQPDHADRAIAAAEEMLRARLPAFCEWMRAAGYGDGFEMGIGLNSGEVMSGQVGSERRLEYTTIGDTVNTASRLEGMTKESEHSILVADSTRAARRGGSPKLVPVGELEVRGRQRPVCVWTLPSIRHPAAASDRHWREADASTSSVKTNRK